LQVKQFLFRPLHVQRVPGGWGPKISRHSSHEGGKVDSPTHWLPLPAGNIPSIFFCWPPGYSVAGRMSMKISNDTIGNRARDLPACGTVTHRKPNACFTCRKKDRSFQTTFLEWPHRQVVCFGHKKFDTITASSFYRQVSKLHLLLFLCVSSSHVDCTFLSPRSRFLISGYHSRHWRT
jgi:hypothetical protein